MNLWMLINPLTIHFTRGWLDMDVTKSRRRPKSNLTTIDFDGINLCDIKYLRPSFDGDVMYLSNPCVNW